MRSARLCWNCAANPISLGVEDRAFCRRRRKQCASTHVNFSLPTSHRSDCSKSRWSRELLVKLNKVRWRMAMLVDCELSLFAVEGTRDYGSRVAQRV
jgi:hypothetical protein